MHAYIYIYLARLVAANGRATTTGLVIVFFIQDSQKDMTNMQQEYLKA